MKAPLSLFYLIVVSALIFSCSTNNSKKTLVEIKTTEGDIVIALSDLTPMHRDNFIKLVESGFYDGVSFHRVIKDFMIQTGDAATKVQPSDFKDYDIPSEINDSLFHKRGVVAAAREGDDVNPARNSSGTQFYIVQGKKYNDTDLIKIEQRIDYNKRQYLYYKALQEERAAAAGDTVSITQDEMQQNAILKVFESTTASGPYVLPDNRKEIYKTTGGAPFLDGAYTIFGEVVEGMDVVDIIANTSTDITDKPYKDIRIIKARLIK